MEPGTEDHDVYVAQLQEVFDSCDGEGAGTLTQTELTTLCSKLQLEDQADALVAKLLGDDPKGTVSLRFVLSFEAASFDENIKFSKTRTIIWILFCISKFDTVGLIKYLSSYRREY